MSDFSIYNKPQNSAVTPDSVKAQRVFEYMQKHNVSMADAKKALGYDISMPQYQEIFVGQNNVQKDPFGNDLSRSSTENNLVQSVPLTAEEAKTVCVSSFSNNIELAQRLMSETLGNQGIIKKGANIYEEITLGNYAKSKVERALSYEKTCAYILALAKDGEITQKEYVEIKLALAINFLYDALQSEKFSHQSKDIINAFLPYGINLAKDSESDVLDATKVIPLLLEELKNCSMDELNEFTDTIMSLSDEQYENVMPAQIEQMLDSQLQRLGIQSTNPTEANFSNINLPKYGVDSIGAILNTSSVEPMKFEEVFRRERGVVYNQQSIEEYAKKESYNNLLVAVNNKCVQIHSLLDTISTNVENTPATRTNYEQNTVLKSFEFDILKSLEILYNGDQSKILEALKKYSGIEDISIDENAISANSSDMTLIKPAIIFNSNNISWKDLLLTICKNLRNDIDQNFACLLGDKTMEDYSNETKQAWKQAYGEKNINTLVEGFQQTQEESLQSVKTGVTTVGILIMVGGMIIPVSPMVAMGMSYGGMAMSTLGTVGVTASEIYSKENGPSDEEIRAMMDELGTSLQMTAAGMAAGKIAEKAFVSAVLSGCPKVAAFIGEVGIDAGISMLADLCITGEIDLTMEGISQLQAFLAGLLRVRGNFNKFLDTHAGTINIPESSTQLKNNDTPKVKSAGEIEGLTTSHLPAQNIDNRDFPVVPEYQFAPSSNPKGYDFESALAAKDVSGNPRFTDGQIQDIRQWHKQNSELVELIITDYDKVAKNFSYTNYFLEYLFNQNFVLDNPDVIIKLLKIKTDDNTCRFTRKDLKNLALAFEILEPETVQKMTEWLKLKQPDGSFLFDVDNVISLAYKIDFVDNMLKQKNPDGSYRYNGNDIFHISRLQGQDDYIDNLIAQNDVEGFPRFSGEELSDLSHNLSCVEVRDCIDTKNPDGSYKYNVYMIKELTNLQLYSIAQRADFEKIFDNIIQYCLDNNINYSKMSKSDVTGQYEIRTRDNKVYVFDASGNFVKTSIPVKKQTISSDDVVSKNGSSSFTARFPQNNIKDITSSVKVEKDKNGNLLYKEYYVPSKDVDGKYEIWRKDATGHKYKIGLAEQTPAGEIIIEKTLTAKDGTTTSYTYIEDTKGQRLNFTQIKDKNGNIILENKQQFKVIDENHFQSIENGITYDIKYYDDKVVVTKDDGMQVELSIGENDFRASTGVLSKDLLPVIKQLPGSVLVDIKKYGLAKIGKNLGFADKNNACFANDTLIDVSNELSGNLFVLLHELGHYRDSNKKLSDNQELLDIYEQERQALFNTSSSIEANAMEYFVGFVHYNPKGAVNELVAETNALLYGNNTWKDIELRGQYLQQYFPKTFAKIAQLLQAEDSGMSNIAKTNNSNSTRVQSVVEDTNSPTSNIVPTKPQIDYLDALNAVDASGKARFSDDEKQILEKLYQTSPEIVEVMVKDINSSSGNYRYSVFDIRGFLKHTFTSKYPDAVLKLLTTKDNDGYHPINSTWHLDEIQRNLQGYLPEKLDEFLELVTQKNASGDFRINRGLAYKIVKGDEKTREFINKLLDAKSENGQYDRFLAYEIENNIGQINPDDYDKILNLLSDYRWKFDDACNIIKAQKINPEITQSLIDEKIDTHPRFNGSDILNLVKIKDKSPEIYTHTLEDKNPDGTPRFSNGISEIISRYDTNNNLDRLQYLLELKTDDNNYRLDGEDILALSRRQERSCTGKIDELLAQKEPDNTYRYSGEEISLIVYRAIDNTSKPELQNLIYDIITHNGIDGKKRFSGEDIDKLIYKIEDAKPEELEKIKEYIFAKKPDGNYKYTATMINKLASAIIKTTGFYTTNTPTVDIDQLTKQFDKIIEYCTENNIKYSNIEELELANMEQQQPFMVTTPDGTQYLFNANGNLFKKIQSDDNNSIVSEIITTETDSRTLTAKYQKSNDSWDFTTLISSVHTEKDANGNVLYKEYYVPSKGVEGKYEIWRKDASGYKYKIGTAEQTLAGEIIIEKSLTAKNGTTTTYTYIEDPKGQRLNFTQIKDKDGNILLENKQQFKIIDENHFQSIENGVTYDIKYYDDKVVITKENGEQVEISIGDNSTNSPDILSKDLLPVIKQLPGFVLIDIKKYGLTKLALGIDSVPDNNALYSSISNRVSLSNELQNNIFVLLHELGHYKDNHQQIAQNQELIDIYKEEYQAMMRNQSQFELDALKYFTDNWDTKMSLGEVIAETNALLYSNNSWENIELRGQYLQQYFPKTFAKIAQLLQAEDSGMSNIAKTNNSNSTRVQSVVESTDSPTASNIVPAKPQTILHAERKLDWNSIDANAFERFNQYEKQNLRELFETSPELAKQLIEEKLPNGRYRFTQLGNVFDAIKKYGHVDDFLYLINLKNPDGSYRLCGPILQNISYYAKGDMEYVKTLFDMQEPDNTYRYTEFDIKNILKIKTFTYTPAAQKLVNDLTEQNINGFKRFTGNEIAQIVEKFKMNKKLQPQILKLIMEKNPNGEFKYPGFMISDMIDKMDPTKSTSSIARFFGKEDTNLKNATSIYENVVHYCESNGIDYTKLKPALDKEKGTYELEFDGQTYYFDADGMFAFTSVKNFDNNSIVNYEKTTNEGVSEFNAKYEPLSTYPTHIYKLISSVRVEKDKNGNLLYKEYYVPSKDVEGKYEIWRKDATGYKYKIGVVEKTSAGEIVIEKTLTAKNGTTTSYTYVEDPKGQRLTSTQIKDKDGNIIFTNKQQYKIIDENHFQTIENGVTYDMRYDGDKLVVTKDNGEQVEFTISNDDNIQRYGFDSSGFIPEELFPVVKHLPGSILFDMKKYNCILMVEKVRTRSVAISPNIIRIYVGEEGYKSLFVVAHELGHYRDYNKRICDNEELIEIYKQERAELKKYASDFEYEAMDYLTEDVLKDSSGNAPPREMNGLKEMIAETNALLYSNNSWEFIELRGQYLQQYFPKTFAKIAELLQE